MTALRSLLSPTALALALTTVFAPLASASGFAKPPAGWSRSSRTDVADAAPAPSVQPMIPAMPDGPGMEPLQVVVTRDNVRAALEQARSESISAFQVYMTNQIYPSNTSAPGKLNVWRDADGHYCAAATIIRTSGRFAISEGVASSNNNLRLINVKDGVLMDWILTSGLTQQEIDRIQEPFMDVREDRQATIDRDKKVAETARLVKTYKATYAALEKNEKASLDIAVNRLMAHPDLARDFLDGSLQIRDLH